MIIDINKLRENLFKKISSFALRCELVHCEDCLKNYKYETSSLRFRKKCRACKSATKYKCAICKEVFENIFLLRSHIKGHLKSDLDRKLNLLHCNNCKKSWSFWKSGESCKKECQECNSKLQYKCGRCKKLYMSLESLQKHLKIQCQKEPKFTCEQCRFKAFKKNDLLFHIKSKHLPAVCSKSRCHKCEKLFSSKNICEHVRRCGLPRELRRHEKRFSCEHCDYMAAKKKHLSMHLIRKHSNKF